MKLVHRTLRSANAGINNPLMANNVINWALSIGNVTPAQKLILVTLANYARKDGSNARPGLDRLVEQTCLSRSGVQKALKELESKKLIQALGYRHGGHGKATAWRCCLEIQGAKNSPPSKSKNSPPSKRFQSVIINGEEIVRDLETGEEVTPETVDSVGG